MASLNRESRRVNHPEYTTIDSARADALANRFLVNIHWINLIMPEFDTSLPSIRQIQSLIADKKEVELKLVTDDLLVGKIFWQDMECICILDHYDQKTVVWRQAIVYMKPKP